MTGRVRENISPPPTKRRKLLEPYPISRQSPLNSLTIYSFNVNGISSFVQTQASIKSFFQTSSSKPPDPSASTDLRSVLRRYGWPALLLLQEVKVAPSDTATRRAVEKAARPAFDDDSSTPSYSVHFCLPSDKHNARGFGGKVYGVCSLIREDFFTTCVDHVREVEWDCEGRLLVCETRETDTIPKLAILNIYAVNGTEHPYKDSETGETVGTRHDRKLQVHELLAAECRALEADGFNVILAGDMNIARTPLDGHPNLRTFPKQHCINRADFERRFFGSVAAIPNVSATAATKTSEHDSMESVEGLNMVDTFRNLWPERAGYTYYPRGKTFGASCDRVDMIITSRPLEQYLMSAGMRETPADRATSDHVPLFASFDFARTKSKET